MNTQKLPSFRTLVIPTLLTFLRKNKSPKEAISLSKTYTVREVAKAKWSKYARFVGQNNQDTMPVGFLYVLCQRAQMDLMNDKSFPIMVPGLIHMENDVEMFSNIQPNLPVEIHVSCTVPPSADGPILPIFNISFFQNSEQIGICKSQYFFQQKGKSKKRQTMRIDTTMCETAISANWEFNSKQGWKYAKVSGDYNPIHLYSWFARALGFKSKLAHGWMLASKAAATVENSTQRKVVALQVAFKRPCLLPGKAVFESKPTSSDEYVFSIRNPEGTLLYLSGKMTLQ